SRDRRIPGRGRSSPGPAPDFRHAHARTDAARIFASDRTDRSIPPADQANPPARDAPAAAADGAAHRRSAPPQRTALRGFRRYAPATRPRDRRAAPPGRAASSSCRDIHVAVATGRALGSAEQVGLGAAFGALAEGETGGAAQLVRVFVEL